MIQTTKWLPGSGHTSIVSPGMEATIELRLLCVNVNVTILKKACAIEI